LSTTGFKGTFQNYGLLGQSIPVDLGRLVAIVYFAMGQLEEAATYAERAASLHPHIGCWISELLVTTYTHLGRHQKARMAFENYAKCTKPVGEYNLRRRMYWYSFKDQEVANRFAEGLLKAGLDGEKSGYYKINEESRLTGEEIKKIYFGRTVTGIQPHVREQWWYKSSKDGKKTKYWIKNYPNWADSGQCWLEGDLLCIQYKKSWGGLKSCFPVYRNPEGTREEKNEYLMVMDIGIFSWSPTD
jgi:tetratricopeptide (TPR) repeat protein